MKDDKILILTLQYSLVREYFVKLFSISYTVIFKNLANVRNNEGQ